LDLEFPLLAGKKVIANAIHFKSDLPRDKGVDMSNELTTVTRVLSVKEAEQLMTELEPEMRTLVSKIKDVLPKIKQVKEAFQHHRVKLLKYRSFRAWVDAVAGVDHSTIYRALKKENNSHQDRNKDKNNEQRRAQYQKIETSKLNQIYELNVAALAAADAHKVGDDKRRVKSLEALANLAANTPPMKKPSWVMSTDTQIKRQIATDLDGLIEAVEKRLEDGMTVTPQEILAEFRKFCAELRGVLPVEPVTQTQTEPPQSEALRRQIMRKTLVN